jgi:hypothetical protein
MRKKIMFVIMTLMCFMLAQIGMSLWSTFFAGGNQWKLTLYNPMAPSAAIDWLLHAIAIAFVVALAITLRHRWRFSMLVSFGIDNYNKTYIAAFWFMIKGVLMTRRAMTAHVITAAIAATLGIAFGRNLTMDVPAGPSALSVIATRALAIVRKLWRRDYQAMLKIAKA